MSTQSQRYAEALTRLEANDRDAYRAVLSRVKSLQTIADKWRDEARTQKWAAEKAERRVQYLDDQLLIAQVELTRVTRG